MQHQPDEIVTVYRRSMQSVSTGPVPLQRWQGVSLHLIRSNVRQLATMKTPTTARCSTGRTGNMGMSGKVPDLGEKMDCWYSVVLCSADCGIDALLNRFIIDSCTFVSRVDTLDSDSAPCIAHN